MIFTLDTEPIYSESCEEADLRGDLLREEGRPLCLFPAAADLVLDEAIPEHSRGDVNPVLAGEFDCSRYFQRINICGFMKARLGDAPLYLRSSVTAVPPFGLPASVSSWGDLVCGEDGPCELGQGRADGADGEVLRGDVEVFFLVLEELWRALALLLV